MRELLEEVAPFLAEVKAGSAEARSRALAILQPRVDAVLESKRSDFERKHSGRFRADRFATYGSGASVADFDGDTPEQLLVWLLDVCKANPS
jgi:hypothetical protein